MITLLVILLGLIVGGVLVLIGAAFSPILIGLGFLVAIDAIVFSTIKTIRKWLSKK